MILLMANRKYSDIEKSYRLYRKLKYKGYRVLFQDFKDINYLYFKFLSDKFIKGDGVSLPFNMGHISILGYKTRKKVNDKIVNTYSINWNKTKLLRDQCEECKNRKDLVYNNNLHSNGITYKIKWSKFKSRIKNRSLYVFRAIRGNKRLIKDLIKLENKQYLMARRVD